LLSNLLRVRGGRPSDRYDDKAETGSIPVRAVAIQMFQSHTTAVVERAALCSSRAQTAFRLGLGRLWVDAVEKVPDMPAS
jgi:hypothetical protein